MVFFHWKSLLAEKRSIPDIHFFTLESEHGSFTGELRTTVTSLEYTGRVSVYASVVNWLLSSRQSPTVAGSGWAVSLQRLTYWTRGWEHAVSTALDGTVVPEQVDDASVLGRWRMADCNTLLSGGAIDGRCRSLMTGKNGRNWVNTVSILTQGWVYMLYLESSWSWWLL